MNHSEPVNYPNHRITIYESAIDRWVIVLLLLSPLTSATIGVYCFAIGKADDAAIMFAAAAVTLLVSIACTLPCRYTLTQDAVSIRCGLFVFYRILYSDIQVAQRTSTWRSGPALSLKRVEIKTNNKTVIVSPADRDRFIEDLDERMGN
jgi:membrane protein YdbS with pleckstrin-like domain